MSACSGLGKVGLVGPGAVGGYYGGLLALGGADLRFVFRSTYEEVSRQGLALVLRASGGERVPVRPLRAYREAAEVGPCDWVSVAAKTTANSRLREMLSPLVCENTRLLTLQNGMGNVERLCFTCINRTSPTVVESIFPGYVQFGQLGGPLNEDAREVMSAFGEAGVDVREATSLDEALWRKLCWNVPFNGLAVACGGITTDEILADAELSRRARVLMEELQAAAAAHGVEIEDAFLERQFILTAPMGPYKPSS